MLDTKAGKKHEIVIRKGNPQDSKDFSRLAIYTAPRFFLYLFGRRVREHIAQLFSQRNNMFSFEHSHFMEVDGKVAGTVALYDHWKAKSQDLRTALLFIKYLKWRAILRAPDLLKARDGVKFSRGDTHISYIALYPRFRGMGLAKALLEKVEAEARTRNVRRVVLRTEVENLRAINLYKNYGYAVNHRMPPLKLRGRQFHFLSISKELN